MRRRTLLAFSLIFAFWVVPVQAGSRFIVRVTGGLPLMRSICLAAGCSVAESIDGAIGEVFLVTTPDFLDPVIVLKTLSSLTGVVDVEPDLLARVADSSTYAIPDALSDTTPVSYFGATVPSGYVNQPAAIIIGLANTLSTFHVSGTGVIAVIDTGVDPNHPALKPVLLPGYDFTRNQNGGDETRDVSLTEPASGSEPQWVSPNTAANVSQSTAAVVDGDPQYGDFGHGTMVAGVIHLVAPTAKILPLKAFRSDGTGYTSDILRALYQAIGRHANVINMSFNLASYSQEVATALSLATLEGAIAVAAAGNSGEEILVYPAALWDVMGVASTTNADQLSSFSNYGQQLVWVAAPGEGIVTTYPFSTYAAGWGTSFSAPLVSGVAALMLSINGLCDQYGSSQSTAHAKPMNSNAGNGRLDAFQALQAWSHAVGEQ